MNNELLDIEYYPEFMDDLDDYTKIPICELGIAASTLPQLAQSIASLTNHSSVGGKGFYYVSGISGNLSKYRDGSGFLGSEIYNGKTNQAILNEVDLNAMDHLSSGIMSISLALTMYQLDQKLNTIMETQNDIKSILLLDKEAELISNLDILNDISQNYKYNINNNEYIKLKLELIQNINKDTHKLIIFYQKQIQSILHDKNLIHLNKDASKKMNDLIQYFNAYRLALYNYSFGIYLETLLFKNFNEDYMNNWINKIRDYSNQYKILYTQSYNVLEEYTSSTVEKQILQIADTSQQVLSHNFRNLKHILKKEDLEDNNIIQSKQDNQYMKQFINVKDIDNQVFVDNLIYTKDLYNKPIDIVIHEDNIYIKTN